MEEILTGVRTESLGSGEAVYLDGVLEYLDDGNGSVFDASCDGWSD